MGNNTSSEEEFIWIDHEKMDNAYIASKKYIYIDENGNKLTGKPMEKGKIRMTTLILTNTNIMSTKYHTKHYKYC